MKKKILILFLIFIVLIKGSFSVSNITVIEVNETNLVNLIPKAYDPDDDALAYSFSLPLDDNGRWQTTYGDAGSYDITVTVSDGESLTTKNVLLIVNKKEEPPTINAYNPTIFELNVDEGKRIDFSVSASDLNKDGLSYVWELDGNVVAKEGFYTYSIDYEQEGRHTVVVYVSDERSSASQEWVVNVNNLDRPPKFEPVGMAWIREDQKLTINLNAIDPDGDEISYSAENLPESSSIDGNVFTWHPGYDTIGREGFWNLLLDKYHLLNKCYKIKFIAKSNELKGEETVTIIVKDINRKPELEPIEDIIVNEGDLVTINAKANDPDGDEISYSYSGWVNKKSYTTKSGDAGTHKVKVTASDGWLADSKDVNIIVKKVNKAPIFKPIKEKIVNENEIVEIKLEANDPDNDEVMFYSTNLTGSSLEGNVFKWKPSFDFVKKGEEDYVNIVFTATDGNLEAKQDVIIFVNNVNRKPEIIETNPSGGVNVNANTPIIFEVKAEDPDDDKLQYKWDFGFFDKYEGKNVIKRMFTTKGNKKVKVTVSDGLEEVSYEWNVKVV